MVVGIGLKYFPFNKLLRVHSAKETEFADPQQIRSQAPNTLFFDFEITPGKEIPGGLYKGLAHSGIYATKAFGQNSYSTAIERKAGEIGIQNLKAVALSAWVYVFPTNKEVKGTFVFASSNEMGVNLCWKGIGLTGSGIPVGKWFKISGYFDLSDITYKPDNKIQIYFWNNSPTDILVDDYYIVFGGPVERRGDSTRVDMTKGFSFNPRFNWPPWTTHYLKRVEINNQNSAYLIRSGTVPEGEITPGDMVISGNFLDTEGGLDAVFVLPKKRKPEVYTYCPGNREFTKIPVVWPPEVVPYLTAPAIHHGRFLPDVKEQILFSGESGILLGQFETIKKPCNLPSGLTTYFQVLWKSSKQAIHNIPAGKGQKLIAADLNGDNQTEILIVSETGSWKLLRFDKHPDGDWKILAEDDHNPVRDWKADNLDCTIFPGRFLPVLKKDILLTVLKNKGSRQFSYSLRKFNPEHAQFDPCFQEKQDYFGKTIGLDTLKPDDQFFTGCLNGKDASDIYCYNRDWRFELKQIRFNDSTFQILCNIDFSGYIQDRNPKYYEDLKMIPGKFVSPDHTSFMVIGRNCKDGSYIGKDCYEYKDVSGLPKFISVYSFVPPYEN